MIQRVRDTAGFWQQRIQLDCFSQSRQLDQEALLHLDTQQHDLPNAKLSRLSVESKAKVG